MRWPRTALEQRETRTVPAQRTARGKPTPGIPEAAERHSGWRTSAIGAEAYAALADGMLASEVWSLLLDLLERRAAQLEPVDLVRQWERDRFTPAGDRRSADVGCAGRASARGRRGLRGAGVVAARAAGPCSVVGPTSQNKIVSALRGTEVVADPTNVLALECARRLRGSRGGRQLATCHRCVRAQPAPKRPGFGQHFRFSAWPPAGRSARTRCSSTDALAEHIVTHLAALDRLEQHGYASRTAR